jgi:hypothetical protein
LQDRAWQANAVKRLEQFFDDACADEQGSDRARHEGAGGQGRRPAHKMYVASYSDLDDKTRESTVKLMQHLRQARRPALKKRSTSSRRAATPTT